MPPFPFTVSILAPPLGSRPAEPDTLIVGAAEIDRSLESNPKGFDYGKGAKRSLTDYWSGVKGQA